MKRIAIAVAYALLASSQVHGPHAQAHSSVTGTEPSSQASSADWAVYHGNPQGTHYSTLDQINTKNVQRLRVAWTFETGDGTPTNDMEGDTIVVKGRMYFASPKGRIFSLNAATGTQNWVYDPDEGAAVSSNGRLRGVCYWAEGSDERILFTSRNRLMAVDANTGKPIQSFGDTGKVDLSQDLGRDPRSVSVNVNSPGVVYKDLIILGSTGATPGHIRAYDVRTGKLRWIFHTIPYPGEFGYDTWPKETWKTANGANVWSGLSLDPERGMSTFRWRQRAWDLRISTEPIARAIRFLAPRWWRLTPIPASVCGTISSWNTTSGIAIHRRHRRSSPFTVRVGTFLL